MSREPLDLDPWTAARFDALYDQLLTASDRAAENRQCVGCVRCDGCVASTFCRECQRMVRCNYCVRCTLCTDSGHCRASSRLIGCNHCVESENCISSSYLVRCIALSNCSYCFGCIGLSDCDFHILNRPYERNDYFAITQKLSRQLGIR